MSNDVLGTPAAKKRSTALWIAIAAVALAVVGTVSAFALTANRDDQATNGSGPSPTPSVTATPAPAAPPTVAGEIDADEAQLTIQTALAAPIGTAGTSADLAAVLKDVAVDAYAAEVEAQWQELISQGWSIDGSPTLVSTEVTSLSADAEPPTAEITACVDSSAVTMLDANGAPIGDDSAKTPRALHLFTLIQGTDDIWRISAHSFPNDPTC